MDADGRVLIMLWRDPASGELIWEPPGGGIEGDETPADAAVRELREETGIQGARFDEAFHLVWRDHVWNGKRVVGEEAFFLARVPASTQVARDDLTPNEQEWLVQTRWVQPTELADLAERVEPPNLASIIDSLLTLDSAEG